MKAKIGDVFELTYTDDTDEFICPVCQANNYTNYDLEYYTQCEVCNSEFKAYIVMELEKIGKPVCMPSLPNNVWVKKK